MRALRSFASACYGLIPISWRLGSRFRQVRTLLDESQHWPAERHEAYQSEQLSRLVDHAYASVPYYRDLFDRLGLRPEDVRKASDLERLPVLTRDEARENEARLVSEAIPRRDLLAVSTSGSSGSPFHLFWDKKIGMQTETAFIWAVAATAGCRAGDVRADLLHDGPTGGVAIYRHHERTLSLATDDLSPNVLRSHLDAMRRYRPRILRGIPSNLLVLASFLHEEGIEAPPSIQLVVYSSEQVFPWQKELIEEAFGCRLFSFYGQTEHAILASECEEGVLYHVFPEYGITELLDADDRRITEPGVAGQLVGTGFHNPATPLLRYATGDVSAWSAERCACGRAYPLLTGVRGRIGEFLIGADGRSIPLINVPYSEIMSGTRHFQFHQREAGVATVRVVLRSGYRDPDCEEILARLRDALPGMTLTLERVEGLTPGARGKVPYVVQDLPTRSET